MSDTTSLLARIATLNAEASAWMAEDPEHRFAGMLVDDVQHWVDMGVHSGYDLDVYLLATDVFELTRSLFGYKPHWGGLRNLTLAQLEAEKQSLLDMSQHMRDDAISYHEDDDMYADANSQYWQDLDAQEAWANPDGELVFMDGCWK